MEQMTSILTSTAASLLEDALATSPDDAENNQTGPINGTQISQDDGSGKNDFLSM